MKNNYTISSEVHFFTKRLERAIRRSCSSFGRFLKSAIDFSTFFLKSSIAFFTVSLSVFTLQN